MTMPPAPPSLLEPPWTTAQTRAALRLYTSGGILDTPNFALVEEVADSTGTARRYCDAIGMDLWKSNGYRLHGYEIKVSRADWLTELKQPDKSAPFRQYVDQWWLVIGDCTIVKDGELPDGWGLIAPFGRTLRVVTRAAIMTPDPVPRPLLAALMRRVVEQSVDADMLHEAEQRGYAAGWSLATTANEQVERSREALRYLRDRTRVVVETMTNALKGAP